MKLPRTITHLARLKNCDAMLTRFLDEVTGLGDRLGVLLVQLAPKLAFDAEAAGRFFAELYTRIATPVALEPRNASWFAPEMDEWLARHRIARVAADPARAAGADEAGGWDGLVYYRWHGSPRIYSSSYGDAVLAALRRRLDERRAAGADSWCIFDNTGLGRGLRQRPHPDRAARKLTNEFSLLRSRLLDASGLNQASAWAATERRAPLAGILGVIACAQRHSPQ